MDKFFEILSNQYVIIALVILVVLLIAVFVTKKMIAKQLKKKLGVAEVRYNSLKSVALPYKLNKAVAIARVNQEVMQSVTNCKDDFEEVQTNLKEIAQLLAETEDFLLVGKHKKVREGLQDLEGTLLIGEKQVADMDAFLNTILEKETAQRAEVTALKDQFRTLKVTAQEKSSALNYCWDKIEEDITANEKMFSAFEEWIYASDFEKASEELENIKGSIYNLETLIQFLPELLEEARGYLPRLIDEVAKNSVALQQQGVSLSHIGAEAQLLKLTDSLEADLAQLRNGRCEGVKENLQSYREELNVLNSKIEEEGVAHNALQKLMVELNDMDQKLRDHTEELKELSSVMVTRFGFEDLRAGLDVVKNNLEEVSKKKESVFDDINNARYSSVENLKSLVDIQEEYVSYQTELQDTQNKMDQARGDEARAKKQILKLQLIMNEMQVKIRKHRLPSISTTYEVDLTQANEYIHSLERLIAETPLNVQLLNATLKDAIDFIYKLYNNVNNVVGMAVMVENTIVFGNKYRSTYPDIDSELTRAELCFRNGEYTQALTIAIATIEKIHPGKYESLIKENAKSATA